MTRNEHLLVILAEECNEVAQRCTKALRFGLTEVQPGQEHTNAQRIRYELADLIGVVEMLYFRLDPKLIGAKKDKVEKFLLYSKKCGLLDSPEERRVTVAVKPDLRRLLKKITKRWGVTDSVVLNEIVVNWLEYGSGSTVEDAEELVGSWLEARGHSVQKQTRRRLRNK